MNQTINNETINLSFNPLKAQFNEYIEWLQDKNLSPNTIQLYTNILGRFQHSPLLTTENIKQYFKEGVKKYQVASLTTYKHCLNSYIKFKELKIEWEKITRLIPRSQRKFFPIISEEELAQLKTAKVEKNKSIWQRNNLILDFLFYSGVRVNELVNIKHSDWQVNNSLKIHGKGNKVRYICLREFLIPHFKTTQQTLLFTNQRQSKIKTEYLRWLIKARTKSANIEKNITPHTFRRSFATLLYNGGAQLTTIQILLGHSSLSTTEKYINNNFEHIKSDYNKIWKS